MVCNYSKGWFQLKIITTLRGFHSNLILLYSISAGHFDAKEEEPEDNNHHHRGGGDDDGISFAPEDIKHVEEVLYDPVDEVVVEDCCPEVCYRTCPCCIGDPDSPFWQLWYRHRLQVSR